MAARRWTGGWVAALLALALLGGLACSRSPGSGATAGGFVGRNGTQFTLGGKPFRFVGVNFYPAAGDPAIYTCGIVPANPEHDLDAWFARIRGETGATVVRFWAFQSFTKGGTDFTGLDRVLRLAAKHGLHVIPVLENQYADCTTGGVKDAAWYADGYKRPYGTYPLSYRDYVQRVVGRYKNNPTILAWMLMNEASSAQNNVGDPNALYTFTAEMSGLVKAADPRHLVTLGVSGGVHLGVWGALKELHALPTIDFIDYHDYGQDDAPLPGAPATTPYALVQTALFTQDQNYAYVATLPRVNVANAWETFSGTIPNGAMPFHSVGLDLEDTSGLPAGDLYVDDIQVGGRTLDLEDGDLAGITVDGPARMDVASGTAFSGGHALHLTFTAPGGALLHVPAGPSDGPGTPFSFHVLVKAAGAVENDALLAGALQAGKDLNKPVLVGEAGMMVCQADQGQQLETPASRAQKLDAKLNAFFGAGGAGYLVWTWSPTSDCGDDFTSGDPLNGVLQRWSQQVARR